MDKRICGDPESCDNCICIGDGDFICDYDEDEPPVMVVSDYEPTVDFGKCGLCDV